MSGESYSSRNHPTLRRGARGDRVVKLQQRLTTHHKDLNKNTFVDGIFGPGTEREVRRFQRDNRLSVDGVVGRNTWTALLRDPQERVASPTGSTARSEDRKEAADAASPRAGGSALADRVKRALERKGFTFNDDGKSYHLNIVGVRSPSNAINSFDDKVILVYRDQNGKLCANEYPITTDPGEYYTQQKLLNKAGAAILVPGQYRDVYKLGKHRGKYEAMVQTGGKVRVWRDGNKDDKLDRSGEIREGWYGINIHRAGATGTTQKVGRYSAGCQVFQNADDFALFISLANKSSGIRGNKFTYTLLEEADLK